MIDRDLSRRRYATALILIGIVIFLYPALTEAYGAIVQYRLNADWQREIAKQQRDGRRAEKEQVARIGNRAVKNENAVMTRALSSDASTFTAPFPSTKIRIPKIGVDQVIVEGVNTEALKNGPGHYPGTPYPGKRGNVGIAGHRVTYTHPFNRVDELVAGDEIVLETLEAVYTYKVTFSKVLYPEDVSMLASSTKKELTLTTCTPKYSAAQRLDVRAELIRSESRRKPTILRRLVERISPQPEERPPRNLLDATISGARESLKHNPRDGEAHLRLGMAYQAQRRFEQAENEYNQAINVNPAAANAHYQLGLLLEQTGKTDKAIEELKRAVGIDPRHEEAIFKLGDIYLRQKDFNSAISILERGIAVAPFSADLHYNLALAYEKAGNKDAAVAQYLEAIKYVPDFAEAKAGLKRLLK